jgi:hypothetical protein
MNASPPQDYDTAGSESAEETDAHSSDSDKEGQMLCDDNTHTAPKVERFFSMLRNSVFTRRLAPRRLEPWQIRET